MIVLAQQLIRFGRTLEPAEAERSARRLYLEIEPQLVAYFVERDLQDIVVLVHLETGSTWLRVTVKGAVAALLVYGGIHQSADYLVRDARTVSVIVSRQAPEVLGIPAASVEMTRTTTGLPGRLSELFHRVERGELSAEEATKLAVQIVKKHADRDDIASVNDLLERLDGELHEAQRKRQENELPLPTPPPPPAIEPERTRRKKERRPQRPAHAPSAPRPVKRRHGVVVTRNPATKELETSTYDTF